MDTPTGDAIGDLPSLPASAIPKQPATPGGEEGAANNAKQNQEQAENKGE